MPKDTDTDKIERLEARIVELENELKALREPVDLSAEEIRTYRKVRNVLSCDKKCSPQFYGRIDIFSKCSCIPMACWATRCSPPDIGDFGGGLERFTDLGS
jgi:hypothetical protein